MNSVGNVLDRVKRIHFIGIGGAGMCPLAEILHSKGYLLSGSDNNETDTLKRIRSLGIPVMMGQRAQNIEGAEMIVYSAAIMKDNEELCAAKASTIPTFERSELLGELTRRYDNCIAVAGTHGKTTVTSMITQIMFGAGADPTAVIGGKLNVIGGNGRVGTTDNMVCEACEFVDTFLKMHPDISVILNIDEDHLDYFGTLENIIKSFRKFVDKTTRTIVVNGDDANSLKAVEGYDKEIITFGFAETNDYYPENITFERSKARFDAMCRGEKLGTVKLNVIGKHNITNALAAIACAIRSGLTFDEALPHLEAFSGAGRRFEELYNKNGITIVDDYAHHPEEL
ncbi:MAG: UDP-N-acetylmuramate--L-alanine ligase, partial [Clostridia bacterium]|nr:UDP-N-acetylmuramate--L-alanine ligase [Clostridia bacterium]